MEKIYVKDKRIISLESLVGPADLIINKLKENISQLQLIGWKNLHFETEGDYEEVTLVLSGERLEFDEEFNKRELKIQKKIQKDYKDTEKRRSLYDTLKKEFDPDEKNK
jgi:hypothetical protein